MISFSIRQYWEFDSKVFPKFPLTNNYFSFLPASVLIKTIFCLWIFCCLCLFYDQFYFWFSMKSRCLAYVQENRCVLISVLIAVFRSVIIGVFWFLNLSFPFWEDLTSFLRLLSAVCFRDLFRLESWIIWGLLITLSAFSDSQVFGPPYLFWTF